MRRSIQKEILMSPRSTQSAVSVATVSLFLLLGSQPAEPSSQRHDRTVRTDHGTPFPPLVLVESPAQKVPPPEIDLGKLEGFSRFEPEFKQHYERHYIDSGYDYSQYRPAYNYGYDLATDSHYTGMDWNKMEPHILRAWDEKRLGLWTRYKEAVQYAWQRVKESKR
jgi:hypothetical protein